MLIDGLLPEFDAVERHRVEVRAGARRTYAAVRGADLGRSALVRLLFATRGIRGALRPGRITLDALRGAGFVLLGEDPGSEIVLGIVGRFWTPRGGLAEVRAEDFTSFDRPGYAKAAWNFHLEPRVAVTLLSTETRVAATDDAARRRFRAYWALVRPFSGLTRSRALGVMKREAERAQA